MHRLLINMTTCVPFSFFSCYHLYLLCCFTLFQFCLSNKLSDNVLCMDSEREALLMFKRDLVDEANRLASWIPENKDCCKWVGIACDNSTGHVRKIHLRPLVPSMNDKDYFDYDASKHKLKGGISPSLLDLKQLKHLDLSCNDFGQIKVPKLFGSFENLRYLNLSMSNFSGVIPPQLGNLSKLHTLCLGRSSAYSYELTSIRNMQWVSNLGMLHHLDLSGVSLHEATNWLQIINTLPSLVHLYLCGCDIPDIDPYVPRLNITSLSSLDLSGNIFSSYMPRWIFSITSLVSLDISRCGFHSIIPSNTYNFRNLTSLKFLHVNGNDFMNSSLTLKELSGSNLIMLDISYCGLSSSVLESLHNLTSLRILDLSQNQLTKRIPKSLGNLCGVGELDLSSNNFSSITLANLLESFFECKLPALESLDVSFNQIGSPLPYVIGQLSCLEGLYIHHNQLNGSLPESIGQLSKLIELYLDYNLLTGVVTEAHFAKLVNLKLLSGTNNNLTLKLQDLNWIPPFQLESLYLDSWVLGPQFPLWIQSQISLRYLSISNTSISSPLPESFIRSFPDLYSLTISHNHIRGTLMKSSIPATASIVDMSFNQFRGSLHHFLCYSGLKVIYYLDLGNNQFSGAIPDCWENFTSLTTLNIENNNLSGEIPKTMGSLSLLFIMKMHGNKITGKLPASLMNLTNLGVLLLGKNNLFGSIPTWIGTKLTSMRILDLRSNNFNGNIPNEVCYLSFVQILDLSHNNLSGNIPRCFNNFSVLSGSRDIPLYNFEGFISIVGSFVTKGREDTYSTFLRLVKLLDLSSNNIVGSIPIELTSLKMLSSLNLSRNQLTGRIPKDVGEITELESLDLSLNKLSGELPMSLSRLHFLSSFNVSFNNLVGKIPTSTQIQSMNESSFIGNKLYGAPLTKSAYVPVEVPKDTKQINDYGRDWGLIISIVLGCITGFWMIMGPLIVKRSWRIAYFGFWSKVRYIFEDVMYKYCFHAR